MSKYDTELSRYFKELFLMNWSSKDILLIEDFFFGLLLIAGLLNELCRLNNFYTKKSSKGLQFIAEAFSYC